MREVGQRLLKGVGSQTRQGVKKRAAAEGNGGKNAGMTWVQCRAQHLGKMTKKNLKINFQICCKINRRI